MGGEHSKQKKYLHFNSLLGCLKNNFNKISDARENSKISFERIVIAIEEGDVLDILEHPDKNKYLNQFLIIVEINSYAYVIPSVITDEYWFLKTIFPGRKYTKKYLQDKNEEKNE